MKSFPGIPPIVMRLAAIGLALAGCGDGQSAAAPPATHAQVDTTTAVEAVSPAVQLVDSLIAPAVAGEDGWNFSRSASVDLDGDGSAERVVLTARVEMYQGRPAWDDGQPWQVYIERAEGERNPVYAQRLQLGTLDMRITRPGEAAGAPSILLIEHLPDRLRIIEVALDRGSDPTAVVAFERDLDPTGELASPALP